jgi:hypothetical protein
MQSVLSNLKGFQSPLNHHLRHFDLLSVLYTIPTHPTDRHIVLSWATCTLSTEPSNPHTDELLLLRLYRCSASDKPIPRLESLHIQLDLEAAYTSCFCLSSHKHTIPAACLPFPSNMDRPRVRPTRQHKSTTLPESLFSNKMSRPPCLSSSGTQNVLATHPPSTITACHMTARTTGSYLSLVSPRSNKQAACLSTALRHPPRQLLVYHVCRPCD